MNEIFLSYKSILVHVYEAVVEQDGNQKCIMFIVYMLYFFHFYQRKVTVT